MVDISSSSCWREHFDVTVNHFEAFNWFWHAGYIPAGFPPFKKLRIQTDRYILNSEMTLWPLHKNILKTQSQNLKLSWRLHCNIRALCRRLQTIHNEPVAILQRLFVIEKMVDSPVTLPDINSFLSRFLVEVSLVELKNTRNRTEGRSFFYEKLRK
jgi:hypothetical protein